MPEDIRPLWIYPWPVTAEDMAILRTVKSRMTTEFKVLPQQASVGCPGRVLALRVVPDFLTDYALLRTLDNEDSVLAALEWAVTDRVDTRATSVLQMLEGVFGPGVKEIPQEQMLLEELSYKLHLDDKTKVPVFK